MSTVRIMKGGIGADDDPTPVDSTSEAYICAGTTRGRVEIHFPGIGNYKLYLDSDAALEIMSVMNAWSIGKPSWG